MEILPITESTEMDAEPQRPDAIPPDVWRTLQEAGQAAAGRLRDLISNKSFERLKPGDQARLIELALNRAYGPPIKREMSLQLSGTVSDAIAESLGRLSAADLPEMAAHGHKAPKMGRTTRNTEQATSGPLSGSEG